jgi:hypothetical protein
MSAHARTASVVVDGRRVAAVRRNAIKGGASGAADAPRRRCAGRVKSTFVT